MSACCHPSSCESDATPAENEREARTWLRLGMAGLLSNRILRRILNNGIVRLIAAIWTQQKVTNIYL